MGLEDIDMEELARIREIKSLESGVLELIGTYLLEKEECGGLLVAQNLKKRYFLYVEATRGYDFSGCESHVFISDYMSRLFDKGNI